MTEATLLQVGASGQPGNAFLVLNDMFGLFTLTSWFLWNGI